MDSHSELKYINCKLMLLDDRLLLFTSNEHVRTFYQYTAQFALTHRERVRGGIQLNITPISYVSNTNYGDLSMMLFTARERGVSYKWHN